MSNYMVFVCVCVLTVSVSALKNIRLGEAIGYPENEENIKMKNKEGRQPVYLPSWCPENELLYPGDQNSDWICDCRPAYLYHPPTDKCWPAWEQGPCAAGQYLMLPKNSAIPTCQQNSCSNRQVRWNGHCEQLGSVQSCKEYHPWSSVLHVNATTLEVGCISLTYANRFGDTPKEFPCYKGSKRNVNGKCVPKDNVNE